MLSTARDRAVVFAAAALLSSAATAGESHVAVSCDTAGDEAVALSQAPAGVRRIRPYVLEVRTKKGVRRFSDQPPHVEDEMAGVHWRYCGYDANTKIHLVGRTDAGSYSGELLMNESGKRLHAGHTVLLSPSGRWYLAIEQTAGEDGEEWSIRDRAGRTLWQGYAGIIEKVDDVETVTATFEKPAWSGQDQLTARAVCAGSKVEVTVSLTVSPLGMLAWKGQVKCEPMN